MKADQKIEEGRAVAYFYAFPVKGRALYFLGKMKGIVFSLFKGEAGILCKILHGNLLFFCKGMTGAHEYVRAGVKKGHKSAAGVTEKTVENPLVDFVQVEDADFTRSGFAERAFIFIDAKLADCVNKGVYGKCVVLG